LTIKYPYLLFSTGVTCLHFGYDSNYKTLHGNTFNKKYWQYLQNKEKHPPWHQGRTSYSKKGEKQIVPTNMRVGISHNVGNDRKNIRKTFQPNNGSFFSEKLDRLLMSSNDGGEKAAASPGVIRNVRKRWINKSPFTGRQSSSEPNLFHVPIIQYSSLTGPAFVTEGENNHFIAAAGTTAVLLCKVTNLRNYTVSVLLRDQLNLICPQ